jgi:hypothetical protein
MAVAHRGLGSSFVEKTPKGMLARVKGESSGICEREPIFFSVGNRFLCGQSVKLYLLKQKGLCRPVLYLLTG